MSELLTIEEMANRLKVQKSWLYQFTRLKDEGAIPHLKVGKYLRFEEAKVLAWIYARNKDAASG
jgi:excisionase family DNA binding protein